MTDPVSHSVGGISGHIFRRSFHISMVALPLLFYEYGGPISDFFKISPTQFVSGVILVMIIGEGTRLKLGFTVFGQRDYESKQVSAIAWGCFAVGMTFLCFPNNPEFGYPLVVSLSLGDPFLGELRRKNLESKPVFIYGSIFIALIWILSWNLLDTPLWLAPFMGPICVASEWPRLRWIDDNATMLLIPLAAIMVVAPWV